MSLKLKFVEQAFAPGANIAALCREYGISRQTGHKWLRRYHDEGALGLVEQSRRPRSSPLSKAEDIVAAIVELRERRPSWGPDKTARVLAARFGGEAPSRSTVARVLKGLGEVKRRRPIARFRAVSGREHADVRAPNDLWTIDFKGWWKAGNGQRCEPLTVRDAYSRYVLTATLVGSTRGTVVKQSPLPNVRGEAVAQSCPAADALPRPAPHSRDAHAACWRRRSSRAAHPAARIGDHDDRHLRSPGARGSPRRGCADRTGKCGSVC